MPLLHRNDPYRRIRRVAWLLLLAAVCTGLATKAYWDRDHQTRHLQAISTRTTALKAWLQPLDQLRTREQFEQVPHIQWPEGGTTARATHPGTGTIVEFLFDEDGKRFGLQWVMSHPAPPYRPVETSIGSLAAQLAPEGGTGVGWPWPLLLVFVFLICRATWPHTGREWMLASAWLVSAFLLVQLMSPEYPLTIRDVFRHHRLFFGAVVGLLVVEEVARVGLFGKDADPARCERCGYALAATRPDACPECGHPTPAWQHAAWTPPEP